MLKRIFLFLLVFAVGCGVSPQDANQELNRLAENQEEWCGFNPQPPIEEIEKASNHPNGYGLTATYGCFDADATWPGGFCWAPFTVNWNVKIFQDGQTAAWFKNATDEYGASQNLLNNAGWDVDRVSGSTPFNMAIHTGTVNPDGSGTLGASFQNNWINRGNVTGQGDYWTYSYCEAWLFKTSIEANWAYQAASDAQRTRYLKNLWQHEMMHCWGLAHRIEVDTKLMSNVYYFPGPKFNSNLNPDAAEIQMFEEFNPLN